MLREVNVVGKTAKLAAKSLPLLKYILTVVNSAFTRFFTRIFK